MTSYNPENRSSDALRNSAVDNPDDSVQLLNYTPRKQPGSSPIKRNGNANVEDGTPSEKERFISMTTTPPVKLDPGWESMDRAPEELDLTPGKQQEPIDRFRIVFFIFLIHGIGILMPWNMFITAKAYFEDYKLNTTDSYKADYRTNFMFYLGIASQVSNAVISAVNTFCQFGGQASTKRIAIAIFSMVVVFILTVILAMIDSSEWPSTFFAVTMMSATVLNCAAGVYQNSVYGQAAILPMKYTNAVVLGNNLCGVFTSVINIISIAASPNPRTAAVYYFIVAIVILLIAFDCYFILPLTKFYQYYCGSIKKSITVKGDQSHMSCSQTCSLYTSSFMESCRIYWKVIKKIYLQVFGVWFVFTVTLTIFPAIQSNVKRINFPISDTYWASLFCFLSFNLFAFLGNLTSEWIRWPGPKYVWIPILLRGVILIPIFLMCNFQPINHERVFPVLIKSDAVYIAAGIIMAFTSGYYSSLTMMYGPKLVEPEMAGRAGMMMAFFLVLGIVTGVNVSLGITKAITYKV